MKRILIFCLTLTFVLCTVCSVCAEETVAESAEDPDEIVEYVDLDADTSDYPAREAFIEDIIACGKRVFDDAGGKLQRAHYAGDIYVCKNFTVYVFRKTRDKYRIAEFPDVPLVIPDNLPKAECRPYSYGYAWKEIPPEKGNPFVIAAQFLYDKTLSKDENMALALEFMKQVKRGDYFQMTAKYSHGTGAHSAVMISDYDPETNTVHWMDSNMVGKKIDGIRYGKVQFDEEKGIEWWASAFCQKGRGATIYRLREDIIFAAGDD